MSWRVTSCPLATILAAMHTRPLLLILCAAMLTSTAAVADEFDDLIAELDPPARFADHTPDFSVSKQTFTFEHMDGPKTMDFFVVKDADRYVAIVPTTGFHTGTIYVQDFRPTHAPTELDMPSERWHIDTAIGSELQTQAYMPDGGGEDTFAFEGGGETITMVRRYKGETTYNRWSHRDKKPQRVDATNTLVFRVDPQTGYVVDGTYDVRAERFPKHYQFTSHAQSGRYAVWPGEATSFRNVATPIGEQGYRGYAMNQPAIIRGRLSCRDGGFVAFLNDVTGWSSTTTVDGGDAPIGVCNAHADLDLTTAIPADLPTGDDGLKRWVQKHRLLAMPPEVTKHVWDHMDLMFDDGEKRIVIRLGVVEGFEDQPLPMITRHRGLAFTGPEPDIVTTHAKTGERSMQVHGYQWPNIPQVALKPDTRYRVRAWVKLEPWDEQRRAEEAAKAEARIAKENETRAEKGQPLKTFDGLGPASFEIRADLYQWTPHGGKWTTEQATNPATNPATADDDGWQLVELVFDSPAWAPFSNIVFLAKNATAYVDDFAFAPVAETTDTD